MIRGKNPEHMRDIGAKADAGANDVQPLYAEINFDHLLLPVKTLLLRQLATQTQPRSI
jgi:hypothetical protein